MSYVTLPSKLILLFCLSILACKTREDRTSLSSAANPCTGSKDRLDCPFKLGVTHATGGNCTQRFLTRLFKKKYSVDDDLNDGFGIWTRTDNRVTTDTNTLKTLRVKVHIGVFKEYYNNSQHKWIRTMEPLQYQRAGRREWDNVVFEWELDTMGAPNNVRSLLALLRLGYFQSGKFTMDNNSVFPDQGGAHWTNESELKERQYSDPVDFYGDYKRVLTIGSAEFQKKLNQILATPDYSNRLKDLLLLTALSTGTDRCEYSKQLLDEQFVQIIQQRAENNRQFKYRSDDAKPEDSLEELAIRLFFRQFHFDFYQGVPFVGSEYGQDPFYTFAENTNWSEQNPEYTKSHHENSSGSPHDFRFGDLIFFNDSAKGEKATGRYDRYIMTSATKFSINPFLALSHDRKHVLPSNTIWRNKTDLAQPTVVGRFINRDGGYNKLIHFLKTAEYMSKQRRQAYRLLTNMAEANIYAFATEVSGNKAQLSELDNQLTQTGDSEKSKELRNQMTKIVASTKLDMDAIQRIVEATRVASWNYGEIESASSETKGDIFKNIIAQEESSPLTIAKSSVSSDDPEELLKAYTKAIISQRPAKSEPVTDLRIMKVEIISTGSYEVDESNLYRIIPGQGTFAPQPKDQEE